MIDYLINLYINTYNTDDKQIEYEYIDIYDDIENIMRKINNKPFSIYNEIYANIVELNMYEYTDPCIDLCICTILDNIPSECE